MNPSLANFMLARTPESIKHPEGHEQEAQAQAQATTNKNNTKMSVNTHFKLNTGAPIPAVGLGTWQSAPGEVAAAVEHALKSGYRHIDAAFVYQNEKEVGEGLKKAFATGEIKREDVFVTSKLWCTFHQTGLPEKCLDQTLQNLGLDYIDLWLMHWPVPMNPNGNHPLFPKHEDGSRDLDTKWSYVDTWKGMEEVQKSGKVKAIGVSNFSVPYLEKLLSEATIVPAANQIENHPYLPQQEIVDFCKEKGILVQAYSPLGSTGSPLFQEEGVQEVAKKHNVGPGTVLISYQGMFELCPSGCILLTWIPQSPAASLLSPSPSQPPESQRTSRSWPSTRQISKRSTRSIKSRA
jgi:glycerol 2-dehydrogenase (NADP+)